MGKCGMAAGRGEIVLAACHPAAYHNAGQGKLSDNRIRHHDQRWVMDNDVKITMAELSGPLSARYGVAAYKILSIILIWRGNSLAQRM